MINWAQLLALAGSAAAISLVGAEYIRPVILPGGLQPHLPTRAIALLVMSVLFVINYLGIKMKRPHAEYIQWPAKNRFPITPALHSCIFASAVLVMQSLRLPPVTIYPLWRDYWERR